MRGVDAPVAKKLQKTKLPYYAALELKRTKKKARKLKQKGAAYAIKTGKFCVDLIALVLEQVTLASDLYYLNSDKYNPEHSPVCLSHNPNTTVGLPPDFTMSHHRTIKLTAEAKGESSNSENISSACNSASNRVSDCSGSSYPKLMPNNVDGVLSTLKYAVNLVKRLAHNLVKRLVDCEGKKHCLLDDSNLLKHEHFGLVAIHLRSVCIKKKFILLYDKCRRNLENSNYK